MYTWVDLETEVVRDHLQVGFMHGYASRGSVDVAQAVNAVHAQSLTQDRFPLEWEHHFREGAGQAAPLQNEAREWVEGVELLQDFLGGGESRSALVPGLPPHS